MSTKPNNTMKIKFPAIFFTLLFIASGCEKITHYEIQGYAQKGAFRIGSTVTLSELSSSLKPTGLNFYSTILDDYGTFRLPDVEISSNLVEIMINGQFFNESKNGYGSTGFTLKGITDISNHSQVNVNVLTHLATYRTKYLVKNDKIDFDEANYQAQNEILAIFNLEEEGSYDYTQLDITNEGILNNKLLAISAIVLGWKSNSELTEFLTKIAIDIESNGTLDDALLQTELANDAELCNVGGIRKNLSDFYNDESGFEGFQEHVLTFRKNTPFIPRYTFDVPGTAPEGINLLSLGDNTILDTLSNYCIRQDFSLADLPWSEFFIEIYRTSETGSIDFIEHDLEGWSFEDESKSVEYGFESALCIIQDYYSASEIPFGIILHGSGELRIRVIIRAGPLSAYSSQYVVERYMKW